MWWAEPGTGAGPRPGPASGPPPWVPPPAGSGLPPGPVPPPARKRPRALVLAAIGAVAIVLIAATGVLYVRSRPSGPSYPKQWDSRVTDIVAFDEKERGLTFKHPVEIEFLSEDDFKADVTSSEDELSSEDRQKIDDETAAFRSLGLIDGGVDLFKEQNDLSGGGTLAYYSPDTKKVRVRGTEITPALRVTLAHELTHALQDQYFDLNATEKKLQTDGEKTAFRALAEGDAVGIENAYVKAMSDADRTAYQNEDKAAGDSSGYDKAPPIMVANFTAPYTVGPPFVAALRAKGGNHGVDAALRKPPVSEAAVLNLFGYLDANTVVPVPVPPLDAGQRHIDDGDFGATTWFLMLARRLDVHDAIKAVDGWGGDSYVTYAGADDKVCVRARYQGRTSADSDAMQTLLQSWADKGTGRSEHVDTRRRRRRARGLRSRFGRQGARHRPLHRRHGAAGHPPRRRQRGLPAAGARRPGQVRGQRRRQPRHPRRRRQPGPDRAGHLHQGVQRRRLGLPLTRARQSPVAVSRCRGPAPPRWPRAASSGSRRRRRGAGRGRQGRPRTPPHRCRDGCRSPAGPS